MTSDKEQVLARRPLRAVSG